MANPAPAIHASQPVLEKTFFTGMGDFADSAKLSSRSRVAFCTILEPFSDNGWRRTAPKACRSFARKFSTTPGDRPGLESEAGDVEDILHDGVCTLRREDLENNTAL